MLKDRRLAALEDTIFSARGTRKYENDGSVRVYIAQSPHAFFFGDWNWSFSHAVSCIADEYPTGIANLDVLCDEPWITSETITWYDPILSDWSFEKDLLASITVKYNRNKEIYTVSIFNNLGSKNKAEKNGTKFVSGSLYTKNDVLKLLNALILWHQLDDEYHSACREEKEKTILAELP